MSRVEVDAQTLAAYIGLLKVMRDYDLKRVISFHGRVQRAKELERSCYQPIWAVLNALRSHDDVLAQELDSFSLALGYH